jgi:flavin reductase (DIM6/NTAB) family NADH-FMN oxidoreductase RutF
MSSGVDPIAYRRVIGRFATGVTVVTTVRDGDQHALTCNSLTSVSLDPVLVLFCAEKVARFHDVVLETGTWAVSVLAAGQEHLSRRFAVRGRPLEDQFSDIPFTRGPLTGAAVVAGAVASLECRTRSTLDAGDHTVVLGEVLAVDRPAADVAPLLWFEGRYRAIAP